MTKLRRAELAAEAARRNREQLARAGADVRKARKRRKLTQRELGTRVGLSQATISRLELGHGGGLSVDTWQRAAVALDIPLKVDLARDPQSEPADAGHLPIQELILRVARGAGFHRTFELATRPADPRRSGDVGLRDDRIRLLAIVEAWNTFGDLGGSIRSSDRKLAEAEDLATAIWGDRPHRIAGCWVVRSTRANRAIIARYPELFVSRFPGSSRAWVDTLTTGSPPPTETALVWCSLDATRLFPVRRRRG